MRRVIEAHRKTLRTHQFENGGVTTKWLERTALPYIHPEFENCVYVGEAFDRSTKTGYAPLLVPTSTFHAGTLILAPPGHGKTQCIIASQAAQHVERPGTSNIFVDCKPDRALLFFIADVAKRAGKRLYVFTNTPGANTHVWPFMSQPFIKQMHPAALADLILTAVGIIELGSQESLFYATKGQQFLTAILRVIERDSFRQFHQYLTENKRKQLRDQIESVQKSKQMISPEGRRLAELDLDELLPFSEEELRTAQGTTALLNVLADDDRISVEPRELAKGVVTIDLEQAFTDKNGAIFYFALAPGGRSISSAFYLQLLFASLDYLVDLHDSNQGKVSRIFLWLDEAMRIPEPLLTVAVSQWRSKGVTPIVSFQSRAQLSPKMAEVINQNMNASICLGAHSNMERELEIKASGTMRRERISRRYDLHPQLWEAYYLSSYTVSHEDTPRTSLNDIIDVTNRPQNGMFTVHQDAEQTNNPVLTGGYSNEVHFPFPLEIDRFLEYDSRPISELTLPGMVDIDGYSHRRARARVPTLPSPGRKAVIPQKKSEDLGSQLRNTIKLLDRKEDLE